MGKEVIALLHVMSQMMSSFTGCGRLNAIRMPAKSQLPPSTHYTMAANTRRKQEMRYEIYFLLEVRRVRGTLSELKRPS